MHFYIKIFLSCIIRVVRVAISRILSQNLRAHVTPRAAQPVYTCSRSRVG